MTNLKSEDKNKTTNANNQDALVIHPENEDIELSDDTLSGIAGGNGNGNGNSNSGGRGANGGG